MKTAIWARRVLTPQRRRSSLAAPAWEEVPPFREPGGSPAREQSFGVGQTAYSLTRLASRPTPSISMTTSSPGPRKRGGSKPAPTP